MGEFSNRISPWRSKCISRRDQAKGKEISQIENFSIFNHYQNCRRYNYLQWNTGMGRGILGHKVQRWTHWSGRVDLCSYRVLQLLPRSTCQKMKITTVNSTTYIVVSKWD